MGSEQCDLGTGCNDECKCGYGWHSDNQTSCYSKCGDNMTAIGKEECDGGEGCDNTTCKCLELWERTGAIMTMPGLPKVPAAVKMEDVPYDQKLDH